MKPLIVLLIAFVLSLGLTRLTSGGIHFYLSGRIAMSVMLLFTSIGHFKFVKGMTMMLPGPIPYKREIVWLTGLMEIAAAILFLLPVMIKAIAVFLVIFFIVLLPANIYAAVKGVDYEKETYNGKGLNYLWFRVPLQLFFIAWVWYFGLL